MGLVIEVIWGLVGEGLGQESNGGYRRRYGPSD